MSLLHTQPATTEWLGDVLYLGRLAEEGDAKALAGDLHGMLKGQSDTPFHAVCASFELTDAECAAFAWCLWRAAGYRPFPSMAELGALCRMLEHPYAQAFSLLLRPEAGALLSAACAALLGQPPRLPSYVRLDPCPRQELFHAQLLLDECDAMLSRCERAAVPQPAALALIGRKGCGKRFLFAELARRRGYTLLIADCCSLTTENLPELAGFAILFNALICLDSYDDSAQPLASGLFEWFSVLLFSCGQSPAVPQGCGALFEREVAELTLEERSTAMQALFGTAVPREELARAAALCRVPVGVLVNASVRLLAEDPADSRLVADRFRQVLRQESAALLSRSAQRLRINKRLEDLFMPPAQKQQLENLCAFARGQDMVWKQWGFEDKIPYGRGITALFYGASGTGKTLAAGVVANELGLELFRVDLSQLISKYIGETQKNIGHVFDDAQNADCVLFFDEADALFSRRGDASDAQDRYANAEIAYLLQRTEQYGGIILLATNLLQNFDEAFRRRIGFMIHFPKPEEELREELWRTVFPPQAPVQELDFTLLARQLELSGSSISACALNAARLAAAEGGEIDMARVVEAARAEYQKLGKAFPAELSRIYPQERSQNK